MPDNIDGDDDLEQFIDRKQLFLSFILLIINKLLHIANKNVPNEKIDKYNQRLKQLENGWVGIGLGSGKFGEDELKRSIGKKREYRSIVIEEYLLDKPKHEEEEYAEY